MAKETRVFISDCDHVDVEAERQVLEAAGEPFEWLHCSTQEEVIEKCKGAVCIINQYVKMDEKIFKAIPTLKFIVRYGVGVDNVNIEDCKAYGIQLCNVPDYGMNEVADHAMALLMALQRKIWVLGKDTEAGHWDFSFGGKIRRPETMTVGIVGTGRIGQALAERAHAFHFQIVAFDQYYVEHVKPEDRLPYIRYVDSLDRLYELSDVISLHCSLDENNYHMINREALAKMREGSYLVNVSRGGLVDEAAVNEALLSGKLAGAGLDVFNCEPLNPNSALFERENCIITPHAAWYSEEASQQLKHDCAALAVAFLNGNIMKDEYRKNRVNNK